MPMEKEADPNPEESQPSGIAELLKDAEKLASNGERERAYQHSLEATNRAPRDPLAWYLRAQVAASREERLFCLSRVYSLDSAFPRANGKMHSALRGLLVEDPSLVYLAETEETYQVRSGIDLLINVPKDRVHKVPFPQRDWGPLRPVFLWLNAALFGLLLGGLGAFIIAPVAAFKSVQLQLRPLERSDRIRLLVILALSVLLWLASIPLVIIFLLHLFQ